MKSVAIHQPNIFPRLKVLQKISYADTWVIFDDVQYVEREWQNRTRLRNYSNPKQEFWLSIPIHKKYGRASTISDVSIVDSVKTRDRTSKVIKSTYKMIPYKSWIYKYVDVVLSSMSFSLSLFATRTVIECFDMLDIEKDTIYSSSIHTNGCKNEKLINLCHSINATNYITGSGGLGYLDFDLFKRNRIAVEVQRWKPPTEKINQSAFEWRNCSFLDYVARFGPEKLKEHLLDNCYGNN